MKFTPDQEWYVLKNAGKLADDTEWRMWAMYCVVLFQLVFFPSWVLLALVVYVGLFVWYVVSQKKRTRRIMALEVEKEEVNG
jgi:hypothetical protein